jgi:hypothetical protein
VHDCWKQSAEEADKISTSLRAIAIGTSHDSWGATHNLFQHSKNLLDVFEGELIGFNNLSVYTLLAAASVPPPLDLPTPPAGTGGSSSAAAAAAAASSAVAEPQVAIHTIYIRGLTCSMSFPLTVSSSDTVSTLKDKICERKGHPVHRQKLSYGGKCLLNGDANLHHYKLENYCSVDLVVESGALGLAPLPLSTAAKKS